MSKESTVRVRSEGERDDAKKRAAQVLTRAVGNATHSNQNDDMRRMLGVSLPRYARIKSDDANDTDIVPNIADILLMDHEHAELVLQEIRNERLKLHGDAPTVTREQRAMRTVRRASAFQTKTLTAMENGAIEPHEVSDIDSERVSLIQELQELGPSLAIAKHAAPGDSRVSNVSPIRGAR